MTARFILAGVARAARLRLNSTVSQSSRMRRQMLASHAFAEDLVRKKGPKDIPDFSRKRPPSRPVAPDQQAKHDAQHRPPPPAPTQTVKPPSTSQKSGRRGQ
jgi:hypothetical protein